ncbi:anti-sigma factor domain-containing protein [Mesobacillus maritimus]|uniref:Anti-sigma factor domain-containing protein n=1 Tax=Mesobacillus maritimus TaxID=1643336 RepID=A0ABS7K5Y2_9BACI|nr:anti-sigma factor domain-containing protein [Mesobacillus maritimus]MBY0097678.1 anti-sigma factor domain-containing protein [Mesobacillus maritimus]
MKKGVILEVKERYVTLVTPDGEFMKTRKLQQDYQIGEELYFYPIEREEGKATFLTSLKGMKGRLILLSFVMFLTVFLFPVNESRRAYAYMSIDVNPSIEMGLNEKLLVVSIVAFNQEGEEILEKVTDWKQEKAAIVAKQILNEIEGQGYLNQEREVLISTVNIENQSTDIELEETVEEIQKVTDEDELIVTVVTATPEERENAVIQGLTTGVYKQNQEPKNENPTSNKGTNRKDKSNQPGTKGKDRSPEVDHSQNGQKSGKGENNDTARKKEKEQNNVKNNNKGNNSKKEKNNNHGNNSKKEKNNNHGNNSKKEKKDNHGNISNKGKNTNNEKKSKKDENKQNNNNRIKEKNQHYQDKHKPKNSHNKNNQYDDNNPKNNHHNNNQHKDNHHESKNRGNGNASNEKN